MTDDKYNWIGKIETVSGIHIDILNPHPDHILLDDIAHALSHMCRYGGHVPHFYSVAEHSTIVAKFLDDNGATPDEILTGLLHDAAEAYVGDMVRPLKEHPEFGQQHKQVENNLLEIIHRKYGGIYPHPDIIHQADRAAYHWEVANIRKGNIKGWQPTQAKQLFIASYINHTNKIKNG